MQKEIKSLHDETIAKAFISSKRKDTGKLQFQAQHIPLVQLRK